MSADRKAVVHEATPLHGFGLTEDEDLHSRVTLQVDAGHMYLHRQERCGRSDAPLPPWETDPEAGIVLPREALANLALALLPHLTGDEVAKVYNALPVTAGAWEPHYAGPRRYSLSGTSYRAIVSHDGNAWKTETWAGGYQATWHETLRAAQAACDARLEAAGVRLCGERVREEGT